MPRGVPNKGFRMTRKRQASGFVPNAEAGIRSLIQSANPVAVKLNEPQIPFETDAEIDKKLRDRFEVMDMMAAATAEGVNRALIISGPPGLGKSFNIHKMLDSLSKEGETNFTFVKGFVRPTGLYKLLYEFRFPNSVIVFDDADSIFADMDALNLLKTACDTMHTRTLSWRAETNMVSSEGEPLPTEFEFEGSIIFITNIDFDRAIGTGNKLAEHFEALVSRSHYLDLAMKTRRDYLIRMKQVVDMGMLSEKGLNKAEQGLIMDFIEKNVEKLRELSLRMVLKIAGLYKMDSRRWEMMARTTCFRQG